MESLLYIMHIDWGWIKQRPHFLAEELSKSFDVTVYHEKLYHAGKQKENQHDLPHLSLHDLWHIPMRRLKPIFNLNRFVMNHILLRKELKRCPLLWLCHPMHYSGHKRKGQFLIYDCMDDVLEFKCSPAIRQQQEKLEAALCRDADLVLASSDYLKKKLETRYGTTNIKVVNNAISLNIEEIQPLPTAIDQLFQSSRKKMVYIGTISSWFNFDLLIKILNQNPNLELILFGPTEVTIPDHPQIKYAGVAEHKYVSSIMSKADALIMPFVVNELIKSVNPVKAYEYIYAHKPVLMPFYEEVDKFKEYIYLYHNEEEATQLLNRLANGELAPKASLENSQQFALKNNWKNRAAFIVEEIRKARGK